MTQNYTCDDKSWLVR